VEFGCFEGFWGVFLESKIQVLLKGYYGKRGGNVSGFS
jgi:hypothetical protein